MTVHYTNVWVIPKYKFNLILNGLIEDLWLCLNSLWWFPKLCVYVHVLFLQRGFEIVIRFLKGCLDSHRGKKISENVRGKDRLSFRPSFTEYPSMIFFWQWAFNKNKRTWLFLRWEADQKRYYFDKLIQFLALSYSVSSRRDESFLKSCRHIMYWLVHSIVI